MISLVMLPSGGGVLIGGFDVLAVYGCRRHKTYTPMDCLL